MARTVGKVGAVVLGWMAVAAVFDFATEALTNYGYPLWWLPAVLCVYSLVIVACRDRVVQFSGATLFIISFALVLLSMFICIDDRDSINAAKTRNLLKTIEVACSLYSQDFESPQPWPEHQLLAALKGDNPRKIRYLEFSEKSVGQSGEVVDAWSRPLLFSISRTTLMIRSLGKDGRLETRDDIVLSISNFANQAVVAPGKARNRRSELKSE